jgi:glycosyltransferase involved in cell wall biosynthesis
MRLLHLNAGNLYGGIETYLVTLAKLASSSPGFSHTFLLTHQGRLSQELQALGAKVLFAGPVRLSRPWTVRRARARLRQVIEERRPEAVIAHGPWPLVVFAPKRVSLRSPVILHLHVHDSTGWLDRLAHLSSIDALVANSEFTAASARRRWRSVPVSVCRYPVLPPPSVDRAAVRDELGLRPDQVAILQVSRFQEWKGQLLHLAALRRLPEGLPWRAFLVGGASRWSELRLRSQIEARARALPPGRFTLLGERADVPRLMQAADIFCQPNTGPEPFGLVFVEALWAGLPLVTTRMGGAVEIVDQSCGFLCAPHPPDVARSLEKLVTDTQLRHALGSVGPDRARKLCGDQEAMRQLREALDAARSRVSTRAGRPAWA